MLAAKCSHGGFESRIGLLRKLNQSALLSFILARDGYNVGCRF